MSSKLDEKRLKHMTQSLQKVALSLHAAVMTLLQTAVDLNAEADDNNLLLNVNLQDILKGNTNSTPGDFVSNLHQALAVVDKDHAVEKSSTRKQRSHRDPNAPIKPKNAFQIYQKDVVNKLKEENPDKTWQGLVHLMSIQWKALPKEIKDKYYDQYKAAKKRFEDENENYIRSKVRTAADTNIHEKNNNVNIKSENKDKAENKVCMESKDQAAAAAAKEEEDICIKVENKEDNEDIAIFPHAQSKNMPTLQAVPSEFSEKNPKKHKYHEDGCNENESIQKPKKHKYHENDDERVYEEKIYEKLQRKLRRKASNKEGKVQEKVTKRTKKCSHEDEKHRCSRNVEKV